MSLVKNMAKAYLSPECRLLRRLIMAKEPLHTAIDGLPEQQITMVMLSLGYDIHQRIVLPVNLGQSVFMQFVNDEMHCVAIRALYHSNESHDCSLKVKFYEEPTSANYKIIDWYEADKRLAA